MPQSWCPTVRYATRASRSLRVCLKTQELIMGCAKDIVEHAGVPRLLFSDFPLGNAAGKPGDAASQDMTLGLALDLLERAEAPRTTVTSPLVWSDDHGWKKDYSNIEQLTAEEIARRRAEFDRGRARAKELRDGSHTSAE